jgi:nicotinamidase-related amidase
VLLDAKDCVLFIVDIQARLAPAILDADDILRRTAVLLTAAARLGVPVVASEQYPQGLGPTDERLALPEGSRTFPKLAFSAAAEPAIVTHLERLSRHQLVLCGMETHVCVLQTALGLQAKGWDVAVVADAVGSRHAERRRLGLERMRGRGIAIVDSEMVVFEWLGAAGTPEFKELSRLIR